MWGGGPIGVGEDKSWPQRDTKKEVREDRSYSFKERYELLLLGADKEPSEEHRNPEMCHRTSQDLPPPLHHNSGKTVAAYASWVPPPPQFPTLCLRLWLAVPGTAAQTPLHFFASRTADSAP